MTHDSQKDKAKTPLQLDSEASNPIDRRKALGLMGFAAIATVAASCGGGTKTSSSSSSFEHQQQQLKQFLRGDSGGRRRPLFRR